RFLAGALPAAALLASLLLLPQAASEARPRTKAQDTASAPSETRRRGRLEEWYRGPVRYLLSRKQEKEFRSLEDDSSRALFIRDFWRARDPNPSTPENEARLAYWQRVTEATKLFNESGRPGWLTDRGRIYILLGAPNDIEQDLNFKVPDRDREMGRGLLRWIYHGRMISGRVAPTFV